MAECPKIQLSEIELAAVGFRAGRLWREGGSFALDGARTANYLESRSTPSPATHRRS
jgi:hypothetical protein